MPLARPRPWVRGVFLALVLWLVFQPDTNAQEPSPSRSHLRWWHGLVALGGYALLTQIDDEFQGFVRDNRSETSDDLARFSKHFGEPQVYATVGLGILTTGLVSGNREVRDAGIRISGALAMTGIAVTVLKVAAGRERPSRQHSDADDFRPFSGNTSAPSGHSAIAFTLAASLSDEIGNPWVTVGLFTLATGTAWSRVNDDVHWFSDVVAGAALGIVTARFMQGKLTIFGIQPPTLRSTGAGVALGWTGRF